MADNTISGYFNLLGATSSAATAAAATAASSSTSSSDSSEKSAASGMDMNDFLSLMVAQLQNQDMYNTVDDSQFVQQMAQYSMIQTLTDLYQMSQSNYSLSLVGKTVSIKDTDGTTISGVVESAYVGSSPDKVLVNGEYYSVKNVTQISSTATTDTSK